MARQTLDQWIHEALTDEDKDGKCTALSLIHRVGVREQEVHTKVLGDRQQDAKELAKMFLNKAENYAAELPGVQTFNLLAFYGGRPQWEAIKPFTVNGESEMPGLATEGPTKEGLVQQSMRHTEAILQTCMRQNQTMLNAMQGMFEQVVRENMSLRKENQEATIVVRDAIIKLTEHREETALKRLEYQRKTEERKAVLSFAPALVNSLTGKEVFPQNSADTALINSLAERISEENFQQLAALGIIPPELMGPLAQRMASHLSRKREAQAQARAALQHVDPEVDATGGHFLNEAAE